ncbi:hypothetical protein Peur_016577 [Populus x canadensis]
MIFIFVPLLSLLSCPFTGVGMLQGLCIFVVEEGASLYWLPVNLFSANLSSLLSAFFFTA